MVKVITDKNPLTIYSILFGIYLFTFIHDAFILSESRTKRSDIVNSSYGGRLKYFTFLNLVPKNFNHFFSKIT